MVHLHIPDMTCGNCERTVKQAVQSVDPSANVSVDLPSHDAVIETSAPSERIIAALDRAGYRSTLRQ